MNRYVVIKIILEEGYGQSILDGFIEELRHDEAVKSVSVLPIIQDDEDVYALLTSE